MRAAGLVQRPAAWTSLPERLANCNGIMTASPSPAPLRYGFIGGGFITAFHLQAIRQIPGIEIAGLTSRRPPEQIAAYAREHHMGEAKIYSSVKELVPHVDVVAIFGPNFTRIETVEEIVDAVQAGAELKGLICEKPLGRNLAEARRLVELVRPLNIPTAYFENQIHMKSIRGALAQLQGVIETMGPLVLVRSGEEHAGPHNAWFWDPVRQGGGVMADMGCHCLGAGWFALTPPGKPVRHLRPTAISAEVSLLKWGQPRQRQLLLDKYGVDYAKTPADDFATGMVTFQHPDTGQLVKSQFSTSWMYDKQAMRIAMDGIGPGYALEMSTLRSPLEIFIGDAAAAGAADSEAAMEKSQATRGLLPVQPNEPDLYGYTDENREASAAFRAGRDALLDWDYGVEIVRLTMAAYLSSERKATLDLTDPATDAELENYIPLIQQGRGAEVLL